MRRLRLLTDLWTLRQSIAFQSVLGHSPAPFASPSFRPAPNFHPEASFPYRALRATHLLIASAPFQVGHYSRLYPAGYGYPLSFGSRHSLLDPSLSRWGFGPSSQSAYCRSLKPLSDRPHRDLHVPHEEDAVRSGCLLYAEVFGVLKPESTTNSGANATTHHRLNQGISMTYCSFDASTKIH
jgi:hypothetical protein